MQIISKIKVVIVTIFFKQFFKQFVKIISNN